MLPTYRSFTGCLRVSAMKLYLRVSAMTPIQGLIAPYYFDRPTWDMRKELENPHIRAPSRPPKSVASAYLQQRFIDESGPGEKHPRRGTLHCRIMVQPRCRPSWLMGGQNASSGRER